MTLVAGRDLSDFAPGLDGRTVNREVRNLVVAAILNTHFGSGSRQYGFRTPALDTDRERPARVRGHGMVEGVHAYAIGAALSRRRCAFRHVPYRRHIRSKAGLAIIDGRPGHQ